MLRILPLPLGFPLPPLAIEPVHMQPLGNQRHRDGADADESPFLFRVFDQFPDNQRREDSGRAHPMSDLAGRNVRRRSAQRAVAPWLSRLRL